MQHMPVMGLILCLATIIDSWINYWISKVKRKDLNLINPIIGDTILFPNVKYDVYIFVLARNQNPVFWMYQVHATLEKNVKLCLAYSAITFNQ